MPTTTTLADFIAEHGITGKALTAPDNPNMPRDAWSRTARHWRVILRRNGRQWTIPFSQGSGHTAPPTAEEVLDCVASDVAGYRNARDLDDFMGEYGYEDREEAAAIYRAIGRQSDHLDRFMADDDAVEALLWNTDRP
jgi:hypothetical protein